MQRFPLWLTLAVLGLGPCVFAQTSCGDCDADGVAPTILDALAAATLGSALGQPSPFQLVNCDVDTGGTINVVDALLLAQATAGLPATLTCRNGLPTATWLAPIGAGGPYTLHPIAVRLDIDDPNLDLVSVRLHYSTDGGFTWVLMDVHASSLTGNPDITATPGAYTFEWDVSTWSWSVSGTVDLRATLFDGTATSQSIEYGVQLDVQQPLPPLASSCVFVLDRSCSSGFWSSSYPVPGVPSPSLLQAEVQMTKDQLARMQPTDEFGIVAFNHTSVLWRLSMQLATAANIADAENFLDLLTSWGGTTFTPPVTAAINVGGGPPQQILLMADGSPNEGLAAVPQITAANAGRCVIETAGFGVTGPAAQLMRDIATLNGGTFTHIP